MKWLTRFQRKQTAIDGPPIDEDGTIAKQFIEAVKKTRKEEYIRMQLNYKIVNVLSYFNLLVLFPIALVNWLLMLFGFFDFALLSHLPWFLFLIIWFLPYATWHYSTITVPKRNGKNIIGDYSKTPKGRFRSIIFNLMPFYILGWNAAGKWVFDNYLGYLTSIRLNPPYNNILITDDLNSLILVAFIAPIVFTGIVVFIQIRDYLINKDLLEEHFQTWESPFLRKYAHEYQMDTCDVIVGFEMDTKKPIIIKEDARFLHEAIIGATGSGKTSTTLLLRIAQDLIKYATGARKNGLVFLEPKGDGVDDVLTLCKKLGIPDSEITVIDPTKNWTKKYNPFFGDRATAASDFTGTLSALAGDQDAFFKDQQNEAATMYSLLAKIRFGNTTNITHIEQIFSDARYLADIVESVRGLINNNINKPKLTKAERLELESYERIVSYFENQVLDYKTFREKDDIRPVLYPAGHKYQGKQMVENKKEKFITGAKKYLNDIAQNPLLLSLFISEEGEEPFNADEFLTKGGIVLVNTALGELDELSLMFGQFFIRNYQSAVFRRAKEDKEKNIKRIPIFFYVDEFPLYANEAFERFLTLGRSYKVGTVIAMQSIAQLEAVGLSYRKAVMGNASHKTVFGRGPVEDNEYFSKEFGEMLVVEESMNESGSPMTNESQTWGYRLNTQKKLAPRFTPTDIRELPFKQMIVQVVNEQNSIAKPKRAVGQFVHESPFVQRFMKLAESEIKSTEEKELYIDQMIGSESFEKFARNISGQEAVYDPSSQGEGELIESTLARSTEVTSSLETLNDNPHVATPVPAIDTNEHLEEHTEAGTEANVEAYTQPEQEEAAAPATETPIEPKMPEMPEVPEVPNNEQTTVEESSNKVSIENPHAVIATDEDWLGALGNNESQEQSSEPTMKKEQEQEAVTPPVTVASNENVEVPGDNDTLAQDNEFETIYDDEEEETNAPLPMPSLADDSAASSMQTPSEHGESTEESFSFPGIDLTGIDAAATYVNLPNFEETLGSQATNDPIENAPLPLGDAVGDESIPNFTEGVTNKHLQFAMNTEGYTASQPPSGVDELIKSITKEPSVIMPPEEPLNAAQAEQNKKKTSSKPAKKQQPLSQPIEEDVEVDDI